MIGELNKKQYEGAIFALFFILPLVYYIAIVIIISKEIEIEEVMGNELG